ncbi:MAG: nucleotidyltransferase [Nitrospirae bacterium]|nr:nucleotidyltransferase [Nitrospirota bacterium]MBI3352083.1 nucleotidyltransferase [Nitrospirota bacterium]
MEKTVKILNELVSKNIIKSYAIGGAIGVMFYTETISTKDLDVFISLHIMPTGIIHLGSIYEYLKKSGYKMEGQHFIIEGIPVDFIPVYDELTLEALEKSVEKTYKKIKAKVFGPEYLIAIALKTGRSQDLRKIDLLKEETKLNEALLIDILKRHHLYEKWKKL